MRGPSSPRRQAAVIGAVLVAAVAVPKAYADDTSVVPVTGAALAAVAISTSTPVVPQAPPTPIVPETPAVSVVSPVIPPAVSPPPALPPNQGSPAELPQAPAGEPPGGQLEQLPGLELSAGGAGGKKPANISGGITSRHRVILPRSRYDIASQKRDEACPQSAGCTKPDPSPWAAAAANVRGRVRELPSPGVTAAELARGRTAHEDAKHDRTKRERSSAGAGQTPAPLVPSQPGRSPEAPPPSALSFSSPGAHGTGSFTVSASVSQLGVAAARALVPAARSPSVPVRGRESDDRVDRPG
jgi:hypothetical protein